MKGPEAHLKDEVKAWLDSLGAYRYMVVPGGYGAQTLDFLVCLRGFFIGVETKAKGKKPTPRQESCIRAIRASGGIAVWGDNLIDIKTNVLTAISEKEKL